MSEFYGFRGDSYILELAKKINEKIMNLLHMEKIIEKERISKDDITAYLMAATYDNVFAIASLMAELLNYTENEKLEEEFNKTIGWVMRVVSQGNITFQNLLQFGIKINKLKSQILKELGIASKPKRITLEDLIS